MNREIQYKNILNWALGLKEQEDEAVLSKIESPRRHIL